MCRSLISKLSVVLALAFTGQLSAALFVVDLGLDAPPSTLGGYFMKAFADNRTTPAWVTEVSPPPGATVSGNLQFDREVEHLQIGVIPDWHTWSHGYQGDVYSVEEDVELLMTLPGNTQAFYFYLEPNLKADFEFGLFVDGLLISKTISGGSGASGFGFYSDDPNIALSSVYILNTDEMADGFAVGEFGISAKAGVPEGGMPLLLTGAVLGLLAMARQRLSA